MEAIPHFFCAILASGMHVICGHRPGGHSRPWFEEAASRSAANSEPWSFGVVGGGEKGLCVSIEC